MTGPQEARLLGGNDYGIGVQANQDPDCLTLYEERGGPLDADLIHICDWPAAKAAIDAFQRARGGRT